MNKGNRLRKKLKNKAGYTLAEMLVAILILLLASSIMVAGIPAAKSSYEGVVEVSNAEVLLSTTISALRNELSTSEDVRIDGSDTITYYNENIGAISKVYIGPDPDTGIEDAIMYQKYAQMGLDEDEETSEPVRLVSQEASTDHLYATFDSVELDDSGVITFKGLSVNKYGTEGTEKSGIANLINNDYNKDGVISFRILSYGDK